MLFASGEPMWKVTRQGPGGANAASVLATQDPQNYDEAIRTGLPVTAKLPGTPIFAFLSEEAALKFVGDHPDRKVRKVYAYGQIVIPTNVLKLKMGWKDYAERFWEDAKLGNTAIRYWPTEKASDSTVAIFGHVVFVK